MTDNSRTCLVNWQNWADTATATLGSWMPSLPWEAAQSDDMRWRARSVDGLYASTKRRLAFAAPRLVGLVVALGHTAPRGSSWRITLHDSSSFSGGFVIEEPVWYATEPFGVLPEGLFTWGGFPADEDLPALGWPAFVFPRPARLAWGVDVEWFLPAGSPGMDLSRLIVGPGIQSEWGITDDWSLRWASGATASRNTIGVRRVVPGLQWREMDVTFADLSQSEASGLFLRMDQRSDKLAGVFVCIDPLDTEHRHDLTVYGQLDDTTPIRAGAAFGLRAKSFKVLEFPA
ncbi:MAG TPA: hypothetical protein VD995_03010 [Azospirillum sp.]|nr:hypothetical protein [Azospirillum sp.]